MTAGRFVTFEGGEGVGKSTQARLLAAALEARGVNVVLTREPGGTPGAETIRNLLLANEGNGWNARAEALLFAAARSDHVERLIRPALAQDHWVICDRFIDSSRAYQGGGSGLEDHDLLNLHAIGSAGLLPDRTILIEVPAEVTAARLAQRDGAAVDRIGGRSAEYHTRVAQAFAQLADAEPERFVRVDGLGERDAIHARILESLVAMLDTTP